ncbi:MAG: ABC transporter permease [Mycobacteriales bacterium]
MTARVPGALAPWPPGSLAPRPGAAPLGRMLRAQTGAELKLVLRNGEQVLLSLLIPLGLLVLLVAVPFIGVDGPRADFFVPGVLALAVMSTAFTGQAIGVGFERQYGVLKRLGATPLPRAVLLVAKTLAVLLVEVLQVALICLLGLLLGWQPQGSVAAVLALVVLGTAAFSGLGLLLGGTLRGLTTLAAANLVWFVLLVLGGVLFPLSAFGAAEPVLSLLPTAALSTGLREVLTAGAVPLREVAALAGWAVLSLAAATRLFRWE